MTSCGASTVVARKSCEFAKIQGLESCQKWQRSFFYVKNPDQVDQEEQVDYISLPEFNIDPPPPYSQPNWGFDTKMTDMEINNIHSYLLEIQDELTVDDLLRTFISHSVSPLHDRVHKICHMSGPYDPTRIITVELDKSAVHRRVRAISQTEMTDDWEWGLQPHSRANPLARVSSLPP